MSDMSADSSIFYVFFQVLGVESEFMAAYEGMMAMGMETHAADEGRRRMYHAVPITQPLPQLQPPQQGPAPQVSAGPQQQVARAATPPAQASAPQPQQQAPAPQVSAASQQIITPPQPQQQQASAPEQAPGQEAYAALEVEACLIRKLDAVHLSFIESFEPTVRDEMYEFGHGELTK
jgi:hypothetical protein